jgi:hypothetical protein
MGDDSNSPKVLATATATIKLDPTAFNDKTYLAQGFRIKTCSPSETIPGVSTCEIEILDTPEGRQALKSMGGKIPGGVSMSFASKKWDE